MNEEVITTLLVETKFRMLRKYNAKIEVDSHCLRRLELYALLKRFFFAIRVWATMGEINTDNFLKKSSKNKVFYIDAEIEMGKGTHCFKKDKDDLTMLSVIPNFKQNEKEFMKKHHFGFDYVHDKKQKNKIKVRVEFYDVIDYGDEIAFPSLA